MKVRTHIFLLIVGCSLVALAVFFASSKLNKRERELSQKVNDGMLVLRDIGSMQRVFTQWMLLSDLIIGSDVTYLCDGAIQQGTQFADLTDAVSEMVADNDHDSLSQIRRFTSEHQQRLERAQCLGHLDREAQLSGMLEKLDTDSVLAVDALQALKTDIQTQVEHNKQLLNMRLKSSRRTDISLVAVFLVSVTTLWIWISSMLSRPISKLAMESQIDQQTEQRFQVKAYYPAEIQQLATSFASLVNDLEVQIAEHKKTRKEREKLHHQLMEASRKAGMAEIASGVLHNVGNVLNSVTVSATLLQTSLGNSNVPRLVVARNALMEHGDDYADYLLRDERGVHFPAALDYITTELVKDHASCTDETKQLIENLCHIKEVIHDQLSRAKSKGVIETFCVMELVQRCIEINRNKADHASVKIQVECPVTLNIRSERSTIQQILINLISNAIDALSRSETQQRVISVRVDARDSQIEIQVQDNGAGIRSENLEKIFMQGFTTREEGHGVGLHSSALQAQALGGALAAASNGPGTGATFSLTIPQTLNELCKV